jgi:hypothetical protein
VFSCGYCTLKVETQALHSMHARAGGVNENRRAERNLGLWFHNVLLSRNWACDIKSNRSPSVF